MWCIRRFPGRHEYNLLAEVELASTISEKQWVRPPGWAWQGLKAPERVLAPW